MRPVIDVRHLNWLREQQHLLKEINWEVYPGQHWAVLGRNGSGKTSLLQMIAGYLWPTRGRVEVLGHRYGSCDLREVRKSIGWVSNSLMEKLNPGERALEVVVSGLYASFGLFEKWGEAEVEQARQMLRMLQAEHLADKRLHQLSDGERQRILLARALISKPRLLILDEPCSGLDLYAREQLLGLISRLAQQPQGPTILYVTHHIEEVLPEFTHVLLMNQGEIVAKGEKQEVLTSATLSRAYHLPVQVTWQFRRPWVQVGPLADKAQG